MLAQVSFEFFVLISILVIIFSYSFFINSNYALEFSEKRVYLEAQSIADIIANEISLAVKAGDGYSRVFYINNKILNSLDYEIIYSNYTVYVVWNNGYVTSKSLSREIQGEIVRGKNIIKNIGGKIYVN